MAISPTEDIIEELRQGRMVVLMDDENRENEGDLVMVAEHARAEDINFMARYGRGLVCLTLTRERCQQLQLPLMVNDNRAQLSTNFTVSIEAAEGVTTGISAGDRARTIQAAVKADARPAEIVQPGHIFPLMAQRGGVLARAGHTEAGVDLARLAGKEAASVICEIMNEDGTMARLPELKVFAGEHNLLIGTIADLIKFRLENEATVQRVGEYSMPTEHGDFNVIAFHDDIRDVVHLALIQGEIDKDQPTLVRVHVQESLADLFTDAHRSGSWTPSQALERVAQEGCGVVVLLDQQCQGDNMLERLQYFKRGAETGSLLQETPHGGEVLRTYGAGCQILADVGVGKMRVMGHAIRLPAMSGFGLEVVENLETSHDRSIESRKQQAG
ncbi:MAG: bifunctional 3,4-dihydroxy-2-butanone-4-phosphate synthase/GTP cyclohydrolase II [Gammaproteobacteria bacterium]|nr:MAG: bifunctional 3,4-dihydroxy-2-butanone-4-phosphate synthase/GTP cyclohydrolase II [Gammaproteobacteria bacterium]